MAPSWRRIKIGPTLQVGFIELSVSPWNSPIFVIYKRAKNKFQLLHYLRDTNAYKKMGSLQSRIPTPTMIPQGHCIIALDFKVFFFSIPLHPNDEEHSTFCVPTLNNQPSMTCYQ